MNGAEFSAKIRVLVVDDSQLMRRQLTAILQADPSIEVIGGAKDGAEALTMANELRPDVITLDVEMPRMNGITALKHIMIKYSIPTIMISALTKEGARTSFDALRYGAIDVVAKPSRREDENLGGQKADIVAKVKRAAVIRMGRSKYLRLNTASPQDKDDTSATTPETKYIVLGAGTGGYYALLKIVTAIPQEFKGALIVTLTVAPRYIDPFVLYLDTHSAIPVRNARNESALHAGVCYVVSADDYPQAYENGDGRLNLAYSTERARESPIDDLFTSLAQTAGSRCVGIVLTGAGADGAKGLLAIRAAGGRCIVQDINNCMDPSMPLAALEKGAVEKIIPDYELADFITNLA